MIKNIIFDLGNVLLDFRPLDFLKNNSSSDSEADELYKNIFRSKEWIELDKGTITDEEAILAISKRIPHLSAQVTHYMENWHEILKPMEENIKILREAKRKGYNTFVLSNFHSHAYKMVFSKYDFFSYFDGGVISSEVMLIKPGYEIYNLLARNHKLLPEESLFIDDMEENIKAAQELGFNTILFTTTTDLVEKMKGFHIF